VCEVYAVITDVEPAAVERVADAMELSAAGPQRREMLAACLWDRGLADGAHVLDIGCGLGKFTDAGIIDPDIGRKACEAVLRGALILDACASDV
jgi:hypothetical protein